LGLDFGSLTESRGFARALRESERVMVALLRCNRATVCYVRGERAAQPCVNSITQGQPTATAQIEIDDPARIPWGLVSGVICLSSPFRWVSRPVGIDRVLTRQLRGVGRADLDEISPVVASALARAPRGKDLN